MIKITKSTLSKAVPLMILASLFVLYFSWFYINEQDLIYGDWANPLNFLGERIIDLDTCEGIAELESHEFNLMFGDEEVLKNRLIKEKELRGCYP